MIPAPQLKVVNHLLGELGYTQADSAWMRSACPPALLRGHHDGDHAVVNDGDRGPAVFGDALVESVLRKIGDVFCNRVSTGFRHGLPSVDPGELADTRAFGLVAYHPDEHQSAWFCRVDLVSQSITPTSAGDDERFGVDWLVTGDAETWLGVLADRSNMAACLRSGSLRYIDRHEWSQQEDLSLEQSLFAMALIEKRLAVVRELLGMAGYAEEASVSGA